MSFPAFPVPMDAFTTFAATVALKTTLVFVLAGALAFLLRRRSAALRHLVWSFAIAGAIALPIASALTPVTLPLLPAPAAAAAQTDADMPPASDFARDGEDRVDVTGDQATPVGTPQDIAERSALSFDASAALVLLWLAGVAVLLARFGVGLRRVRGMVRRASPVTDDGWLLLADRVRQDGTRPAFTLRVSNEVAMPFATGFVAPAIVLPAASLDWTDERREAVLLHELAHLSRGDLLMNALSHLARALHWFNPLAWHAAHRLRIEGERSCDDAVLRRGKRPSDYADHLLSIASSGSGGVPTVALAMARPSAFEGRLLAILEPDIERAAPSRLRVAMTTAAFLAIILPLAAASPTARAAAMPSERAAAMPPARTVAMTPAPAAATPPAQDPAPETQVAEQVITNRLAVVPALVEALADANANVRLAAVSSLASLEDPRAIAALGKALKEDTDARVREAAADALGDIDDPRAVPYLVDALKSERVPAVREQIVESLGEIDDPSAVPGIIAAAKDPSVAVRRAVVSALGDLEEQSAVPAIISMAGDEDVEVRRYVASALGDLENLAGLEALTTLARDSDAEVRSEAIDALGSLEDRRTMDVLVAALKDPVADVRVQAAEAIQNLPDIRTAPAALIAALGDADHDVKEAVANALGDIGDKAAVPALKRALADPNAAVRREVAEALSDIGGAEAITILMGLLKDQDPEIRRIAAEALGDRE